MAEKSASVRRVRQETSKRSGRPSKEAARKVYTEVQKKEDEYNYDYLRLDEGQDKRFHSSERANRFPVRLFPRDEYDTVAAMKQKAPPSLGEKTLTTDDLQWMKRKLESEQFADKKQWILSQFDLRDAAQREMFQRIFPEFLREQESIIDERLDLAGRVAKLRLRGPVSADDFNLLYLLNNGTIKLPKGNIWDPVDWKPTSSAAEIKARGLFNPLRYSQSVKPGGTFSWDPVKANLSHGTAAALHAVATGSGGNQATGTVEGTEFLRGLASS